MDTINLGLMESVYGKHLYIDKNEIKADYEYCYFFFYFLALYFTIKDLKSLLLALVKTCVPGCLPL